MIKLITIVFLLIYIGCAEQQSIAEQEDDDDSIVVKHLPTGLVYVGSETMSDETKQFIDVITEYNTYKECYTEYLALKHQQEIYDNELETFEILTKEMGNNQCLVGMYIYYHKEVVKKITDELHILDSNKEDSKYDIIFKKIMRLQILMTHQSRVMTAELKLHRQNISSLLKLE